jgi:hypothetical protein
VDSKNTLLNRVISLHFIYSAIFSSVNEQVADRIFILFCANVIYTERNHSFNVLQMVWVLLLPPVNDE